MTTANPLVVGPVNTSTAFAGTFLLEDCEMIASGIKNGDWIEGGLGAFAAVADGVAAVIDPLGSAIGMGIGWLIEHMEPIKGWFNDLTGDAGEVLGFAGTWENIAAQMQSASDELTRILGDLSSQHGAMISAYRDFQTKSAAHAAAAGRLSGAIGQGMGIASTIVQMVHDITRDALSQAIGTAISAATTIGCTLGLGTPWAIGQVTSRVSALTARVGKFVTKLLEAIKKLLPLLDDAARLFRDLKGAFDEVLTGATHAIQKGIDAINLPGLTRGPDVPVRGGGPTPLRDGDVVDMSGYHGSSQPPQTANGPATFTPADFRTGPGEATFWSGRSDLPDGTTIGSGGVASDFAHGTHRTTLENTLNDRGISMPDYDPNIPDSVAAWDTASAHYAAGAQGDVTVVLGESIRPNSIWETTEFPRLQQNPNVTSISAVNAKTGVVTHLWP